SKYSLDIRNHKSAVRESTMLNATAQLSKVSMSVKKDAFWFHANTSSTAAAISPRRTTANRILLILKIPATRAKTANPDNTNTELIRSYSYRLIIIITPRRRHNRAPFEPIVLTSHYLFDKQKRSSTSRQLHLRRYSSMDQGTRRSKR